MHPFYGARLVINADDVFLKCNNGDDARIALAEVDYITIYRFEDMETHERCWVNLRSYTKQAVGVSTLAGNFAALEKIIMQWDNFDVQQYAKIRAVNIEVKETVLWQKTHQADFAITPLNVQAHTDALSQLQQGLWIENLAQFLPWSTYEDLARHPAIKQRRKTFPNPSFKAQEYVLHQPTIFNGLKLTSLYTASDASQNVLQLHLPVIEYASEISLGANRQKSFAAIKTHLDAFFQRETVSAPIDYAKKDTWRANWQTGAVRVELYCFYREMPDGWDNIAWLRIHFSPNLAPFYSNDYQRNLMLSHDVEYQLLDVGINLNANYREVSNAIYTPVCFEPLLTQAHPSAIWYDKSQGLVGFCSAQFALIFNADEIEHLNLAVQNFRGSEGRNGLELAYQNQMVQFGSVTSVEKFTQNMQKISKLIGKKVDTYTYDEHY
ncbi:MAG TPA: hypothetical protein PL131_08870 [Methylotenera sp.]|nr:hypothetical protein [Methylotenera sp.]HPH05972.1 hypothetical protein [Methylotenera sp.]HPN00550.1 hypothetical protein [Methylotenera sp.]